MVSEFYSRGFKEELLSDIFGWSTFLNGLIAILSGVVANFLVDLFGRGSLGYVMPFMASIVVLVFSFLVVFFTWKENYGQGSTNSTKQSGSNIWNAISEIRNDRKTFAVGVMQCCFESAMYTFVFMWSPALEKIASEKTSIPFGLVFASFMVSIMIGSLFFRILSNHHSNENIARMAFALSTVSFMMCIVNIKTEFLLFFWFNVFECSCGIYFPSVGTMRGKYVKEETRATVMNVFRVPLNLIVVVSLLKVDSMAFSSVFLICACSNIIGFACSHAMVSMAGNGSKAVPTAGQDEYEI